jgi:hypothetical protein
MDVEDCSNDAHGDGDGDGFEGTSMTAGTINRAAINLFADLDDDDEDGVGVHEYKNSHGHDSSAAAAGVTKHLSISAMRPARIPISPDGVITGNPVASVDKNDLSVQAFNSQYRATAPVLIKHCCDGWDLTSAFGSSTRTDIAEGSSIHDLLARDGNDERLKVLVASDGTNFLRHELCSEKDVSLHEFIASNFGIVRQVVSSAELAVPSSASSSMSSDSNSRMYCRVYADKYPSISEAISLPYLHSLAFAEGEEDHSNENMTGFKPSNIGLWISSPSCITPLHFDICHGFLNQIEGRKRFILVSPEDTPYVYWRYSGQLHHEMLLLDSGSTKNGTSSYANLWRYLHEPNVRIACPLFEEVNWWVADLEPGG